jgi:hypothetical protein
MSETTNSRLKIFISKYYDGSITNYAKQSNKTVSQISQIARGEANIGSNLASKLEKTTGISAQWLLHGTGDMVSDNNVGIELKNSATCVEKPNNDSAGINSGDKVRIVASDGNVTTGIIEKL